MGLSCLPEQLDERSQFRLTEMPELTLAAAVDIGSQIVDNRDARRSD